MQLVFWEWVVGRKERWEGIKEGVEWNGVSVLVVVAEREGSGGVFGDMRVGEGQEWRKIGERPKEGWNRKRVW